MTCATWVIQSNRIKTSQTLPLVQALRGLGEPLLDVCIADGEFITNFDHWVGNRIIPYGSTQLVEMALLAGWKYLFFDRARFRVDAWRAHPKMLNWDAEIMTLSQAKQIACSRGKWFIRPLHDLKQFHGHVIDAAELVQWVTRLEQGDCEVKGDTKVALSSPKEIQMEWRYFIVGGRIVTGSSYRFKGQPHQKREIDVDVIAEAQAMADLWLPHECCCMDVALVDGEPRVIEFNCLNASGFYDHDIEAFARAVSKYAREH